MQPSFSTKAAAAFGAVLGLVVLFPEAGRPAAAAGEASPPSKVEATYSVSAYAASLVPVLSGTFEIKTSFSGNAYDMTSVGSLSGLTSWSGQSQASGSISDGHAQPAAFVLDESDSQKKKHHALTFTEGSVVDVQPPIKTGGDRVPVKPNQLKNVVDPLSALVDLTSGQSRKPVCSRTFRVFDGQARIDVQLRPAGTEHIEVASYKGPAIVCSARYIPVSGHKASAAGVQALMDTSFKIWMVRMKGTAVYAPAKITASNSWLTVEIEQQRFRVNTLDGKKVVMQ